MYVGGLKPYSESIFKKHSLFVLLWLWTVFFFIFKFPCHWVSTSSQQVQVPFSALICLWLWWCFICFWELICFNNTFKNEIAYFFPLCVRKRKTFVVIFRRYVLNVPITIALYKVVVHIQDTLSCAPSCLFCFSLLYSVSVYFKMLNFPSYFPH